jgi:hypothetical protein
MSGNNNITINMPYIIDSSSIKPKPHFYDQTSRDNPVLIKLK